MREHNFSSISNTSIHEAYPGHHLQLAVGNRHPSLTRLMTDAPEFVEGWGMYSEQMMREHGFDDGPAFRVSLYTDAVWRACRIILDVRMHRGEISVEDAIDFLVEQTGFERPNARAEVHRYTYTPTYQMSYLLGKVMLLGLRSDEQRRLGDRFSLKAIPRRPASCGQHPGQLPPPAARRWGGRRGWQLERREPRRRRQGLAGTRLTAMLIIPSLDIEGGRSRLVYWPGASTGVGSPTDRPEIIVGGFVNAGATLVHLVDFDGARAGAPRNLEAVGAIASRVAVPLQLAGGLEDPDAIRLAFAAGATRIVLSVAHRRRDVTAGRVHRGRRRLAGRRPRPAAGTACRVPMATIDTPTLEGLIAELVGLGVRRFVLSHGGAEPDLESLRMLVRATDAELLVAGGASDRAAISRLRDTGIAGLILGEPLLSGALDLTTALEAAA